MTNPKKTVDQRGAIRIVRETLTDGSHVYNVWLDDGPLRVVWECQNESTALDLADALEAHPTFSIE